MDIATSKQVARTWTPHEYQRTAEKFIYQRTIANGPKGGGALFLDPGLGKTSICLNAVSMMKQLGYIRRALIVAPLRVCQRVWPDEIKRWSNFQHLSYAMVHGTQAKRMRALSMPMDLHIINRENIDWLNTLCSRRDSLPWDLIIIDESTSFKAWSSVRSKAMRKLCCRIPYRLILTGTPSPKDLTDLFPQIWLLDEGESLGKNVTKFRERFCVQDGPQRFMKYEVRKGMQQEIQEAIAHLCLRLDIKDYLSMPELIFNDVLVDLPDDVMTSYLDLEKQMFIALDEVGATRDISHAGALYSACKQVANGGLYDNDHVGHSIHHEKVKAAREIVDELQGKPVIIAYQYEHDVDRLKKEFPGIKVIKGGMKSSDFDAVLDGWNSGSVIELAVQAQALSHGANMQYGAGRDIIWLGLPDSLEIYLQLNARLWRQGVDSTVRIHRVLAANTVDLMVRDRTDSKQDVQTSLLQSLKEYRHSLET